MRLYMVRHGESEANRTNCLSLFETPLSEKGIEDARSAGRMLRGIDFDKILVSPYFRARQTQQYAIPNEEAMVVELLHECDCGNLEGRPYPEVLTEYPELEDLIEIDDFTKVGGEDYANIRRRIREFMEYVLSLGAKRVVAFTHAGVILTFFDEVMKRDGKPGRNILCDNGSISIFEYENGKWSVVSMNITEKI